jgi:UDP-N-acetyl-D-mannosaminuronic acid dehydrogenase
MDPDPSAVVRAIEDCLPHMDESQLVVLRSTVYPGVTRRVEELLGRSGVRVDVAFCPERIVEGQAMRELRALPQIVGARTDSAAERACALFETLGVSTIRVLPEEAELAKLFTNTWRYIKFAAANQFWLMSNEAGLDYSRIREAITADYPRAADLPGAGFAAGPCLFKDTMQLAAFTNNNFMLGHAAMMVNEGQPLYVVDRIASQYDLPSLTVGILGMAFKGGSDDTRASLSYKLRRILRFRAREVLTTDPFVTTDPSLLPLDEVLNRADLLIIGAPHPHYRELQTDKPVIDVWNLRGNGTLV